MIIWNLSSITKIVLSIYFKIRVERLASQRADQMLLLDQTVAKNSQMIAMF